MGKELYYNNRYRNLYKFVYAIPITIDDRILLISYGLLFCCPGVAA
jgi:hypothetical protein